MVTLRPTILIVDDELSSWEAFVPAMGDMYDVIACESERHALDILCQQTDIDLIILSHESPPGIDGLKVFEKIKESGCEAPVIVVTGRGSEDVAVKAFKLGAKDYIPRPFAIGELLRAVKDVLGMPARGRSPVDRAMEFMEEHYCQPISASDVAEGVGLSLSYLEHTFKQRMNRSITHHMYSLRIEKARELLLDRRARIKEIAAQTGFRDQYYFCKVFKKYVGCTPSEYRESLG